MKKTIVLLLLAVLATCILSSCSPKDTGTMERARTALEQGDYENAAALYQAAIDEGKQLQACYRGKGIALMGKMEYKAAEEAFNKALESGPQKSILVYNALIERDDSSVTLYTERGTAKAAAGELDGAKADFDKAINMDRGNYERILNIAQTLAKYGGKSIGEGYLQGAASADPNMDPILKGRILYFMGDYQGAVDLLSQYAETDETAALTVCRCYIALEDTEAAKSVIETFGSKVDTSAELLSLLGSIQMKQGNYAEAVEVYERAVEAAKGTSEQQNTLYNRIVAYEYAGDFTKAGELMADYLQQYSGDEEAKRELRFLKTR